ncbi:hypothetical protein C8J57DRAFT_387452 [Mycena rebaudengoi]|nr:hypothetical protein C8J57DRAFT_387452 [Mycena rebaudengoi]
MCVERAQLDRTLQEERAARKTEQETTRIEHAEAERLHRDEHAARQRVLEAIYLERSNLEASLDHEQSARKQEQEAFQLERTEAKNLQERLRTEMAQVAHESDLLASRLDDALRTSTPSAPIPLHGPSATQPIGRIVVKREPKNTAVKKEESPDRNFITPRTLRLPQDNTSPVLQLSALHELPQNPHTGRIVVPREPKDTAVKTEDSANRNFVTPRKRRLPPDNAIQVEGPPSKKFLSTKKAAVSQPPGTRKVEVVITRRSGEIQPGLRNGPPASSGGSSSQPLLGAAKHPPGSAVEEWGTLQFFCPNLTTLSTSQMMSGDLLPPSTSWATSQGTRDNTAVAGLLPPAGKALLDAPIFNECLWITHFFDRSAPLDGLLADPALALYVPFITHLHEPTESRSSAYRGEVSGAAPPGDAFIDNVAGTRMSEDAWGLVLRFLVLDVLLLYKGHKPAPCVLPDGSGIPTMPSGSCRSCIDGRRI